MEDDRIVLTDYRGDNNVGFHGVATDEFLVLPPDFKRSEIVSGQKMRKVERMRISNTDLIGLFASANSEGILLPDIVSDHEKSMLEDSEIDFRVLETEYTALGNMVMVNDTGCMIAEGLEPVKEEISEFFGVHVKVGTVAGLDIVGSAGIVTNNGLLLHREATEDELEFAEELFGVEGDIGTVNFGSPYVGSGLLANSNGVVAGNGTTGPETARIIKSLGFL